MNQKQENLTGYLLLLIALCIKTFLIRNHPLGYDELSAVFRATIPDWKSHIEKGVIPDGHPAGVQTWLWLWLKMFGDTAFILKFQAVLAGVMASFFLWKSMSRLFGPTAGLTGLVFLLFSPLAFHWSMQFRPYAFGMLFIALMWWTYTNNEKLKTNPVLFIVSGAVVLSACGYIHYFAGLSAFLILLYFLINSVISTQHFIYTLALAAVLYLPGLGIFLRQLENGGLDWLGKPDLSFFYTHLVLITTGNKFLTAAFFILLLLTVKRYKSNASQTKATIILFSLWLLPAISGFIWSYIQKPVLQNSVLLFSSPFLFGAVAAQLSSVANKTKTAFIIVTTTFIACIFSLHQRQLFGQANKEAWYNISAQMKSLKGDHPEAAFWYDGPQDIFEYHWNQKPHSGNLPAPLFRYGNSGLTLQLKALTDSLMKLKIAGIGINSGTFAGLIPVVEDNTNAEIQRTYYPFGEFLLIRNNPELGTDPKRQNSLKYQPLTGKAFTLNELNASHNDVIVIRMKITDTVNLRIISSITHDAQQIDWRESQVIQWKKAGFGHAYLFIRIADIPGVKPKSEIKVWIAGDKGPETGRPLEIRVSKGNPLLYGTLNE